MADEFNPRISVLVAAYNVEQYIEKCVRSIINQTYSNLEIIIVDDCSKDSTGSICDNLAKEDDRVVCIHHKENKKLPGARNTGLDVATGEYVVFVDGDDWLAEDCVEYLYNLTLDKKADIAISATNFTTRDMAQTQNDFTEIWDAEVATANFLYSRIPIGAWNKIYRRKFIEDNKLRFKPLFTAEGFRFISDCSQRCEFVVVGHRRVYYYRLNNPKSATTLPDIRQGLGASEALDGIERDLLLRTPKVLKSIHHHRWLNKFYTLRIILENGIIEENDEVYRECIKYIRANGFSVAVESKNIKIIIKSMFPVYFGRRDIIKKNKELMEDIKKEKTKNTKGRESLGSGSAPS